MVAEASDYIRANVKGLILGQNLFTNRLPHADADLTNGALFLDSVVGLRPTTWIGKAAKYEYPRLQVVGASHDEHHYEIASQLVNDVFTLLAETFNREVG